MTTPRRRLIRPALPPASPRPQPDHQTQKLRSRLEKERTALARWMSKLKRAFNTVQKLQQCIVRIERRITHLEE